MGFGALAYAQQFRDICREIARKEIENLRPKPMLATVTSIDFPAGKCMVQFPGESTSVPIRLFTIAPAVAGTVVRVEGDAGMRYVADVVSGQATLLLRAANGNRYRVVASNTGTLTVTPA